MTHAMTEQVQDPEAEARLRAMLRCVRSPARDEAGLVREANELWEEITRECEEDDLAPCPNLGVFLEFVSDLREGRLRPAGLGEPIPFDFENTGLSGRELVTLLALKRNMWVTMRSWREVPENESLSDWYAGKARQLAAWLQ